ncbi:MAG: ankyrin repeat domain-containing protein [Gammaproteobacteria bacterium]
MFLQKGAISKDIDFSKYAETSKVKMAIDKNCLHLVELLIAKDLLKTKGEAEKIIFINCAVGHGHIEIWDQLTRFHYKMPLAYFLLEGYLTRSGHESEKCLEVLEKVFKCRKEAINESYKESSLLIQAVIAGDIMLVNFLLEQGADPNFRGNNGETAILAACIKEQTQILKSLLEKSGDPNLKRNNELSPLYITLGIALRKKDFKAFEMLLKYGADPNVETSIEGGMLRPLDMAFTENNFVPVELLLKHGADIEYQCDILFKKLSELTLENIRLGNLNKSITSPLGMMLASYLFRYMEIDNSPFFLKTMKLLMKTYASREILMEESLLNELIATANALGNNELGALFASFQEDQAILHQKRAQMMLATSVISSPQVDPIAIQIVNNVSPAEKDSIPAATIEKSIASKESANDNNNNMNAAQDGESAFTYLKKFGFTPQEITDMRKRSAERNKKNVDKIAKYSKQTFWDKYHVPESLSWQGVKFNKRHLQEMFLGENRFFYLDAKALEMQRCSEEMLQSFKNVRARMDDIHIKILEGDHYLDASINEEALHYGIRMTHELRIFNSEARVLLFPLASDEDKKYQLYIACKFMPQGLHTLKDEKALKQSNKGKKHSQHKHVLKVTLAPPDDDAMAPSCSTKTFTAMTSSR